MRAWSKYVVATGMLVVASLAAGDVKVRSVKPKTDVPVNSYFEITRDGHTEMKIKGLVTSSPGSAVKPEAKIEVYEESFKMNMGAAPENGLIVYANVSGKKADDQMPEITYDDLDAGADGTAWMMEKVSDTQVRVYLLSEGTIVLQQNKTVVKMLNDAFTYVVVERTANTWNSTNPKSIWDDKTVAVIYQHVQEILQDEE